jgi:hypothetical protein
MEGSISRWHDANTGFDPIVLRAWSDRVRRSLGRPHGPCADLAGGRAGADRRWPFLSTASAPVPDPMGRDCLAVSLFPHRVEMANGRWQMEDDPSPPFFICHLSFVIDHQPFILGSGDRRVAVAGLVVAEHDLVGDGVAREVGVRGGGARRLDRDGRGGQGAEPDAEPVHQRP